MKNRKAVILIALPVLLLTALFLSTAVHAHRCEAKYQQALELYEAKDYETAYDLFSSLEDWRREAWAYARVCRSRMYLAEGSVTGVAREMYGVSSSLWPPELQEAIRSVLDDSAAADRRNTTIVYAAPRPTQAPVWTPRPTPRAWYDEDEYDVQDYDDPDDFYYDHYDDFFEYYDAEDYWYDHHGD